MKLQRVFSRLAALCFAGILLTGCGGGSAGFPRDIEYRNLQGVAGGKVIGPGLSLVQIWATNCDPGKVWCLSSMTVLTSQEQFRSFIAGMPFDEDSKNALLESGSGVDFSRNQIWAFKLGVSGVAHVGLKLRELESSLEVQAVICPSIPLDLPAFLADVFAVVPRDLPAKKAVYLDRVVVEFSNAEPPVDNCPVPR